MERAIFQPTKIKDENGAVILEMALVIPVVVFFGLGVLEFSNYFFNFQLIQNGVRDAARYAASLPYDSNNKTKNDAAIKNIATTGVTASGTKRVSWWSSADVIVTWGTITNTNGTSYRYSGDVPVVTVSTSVSYPPLGFLSLFGLSTLKLKTSHQERVFGVR